MTSLYDVSIRISKEIYDKEIMMKTAYLFSNRAYIHITLTDNGDWLVNMKMKDKLKKVPPEEFENELLAETVRCQIYKKTHSIRELLLARALSSSIIEEDDAVERIMEEQNSVSDQELGNILEDWFEKNEK